MYKRMTESYVQSIDAETETVFSLLCPVREAEWLAGFNYELIYSESGFVEEGCVFITKHDGLKKTLWIVTKRDSDKKEIEFVFFVFDSIVTKLSIRVNAKNENTSNVSITYMHTALSEGGNRLLEGKTEENFTKRMKFWEKSMNHYIKTGKKLKLDHLTIEHHGSTN
ncbi:hypothetical protein KAU34_06515 [candidate division WOR-3 bacterium]|nr:hypothetical protein [candidate division WOR-3 bacterium]